MVFLFVMSLVTAFFLLNLHYVSAQDSTDDQAQELKDKIDEYEKKLAKYESQASSLAKEIEYINTQISLTGLRIQNSNNTIAKKESQIAKLASNITDLSQRIDKLIFSIDYQRKVLNERIREKYKTREVTPVFVLFGSSTLSELIKKAEYLAVMGLHDKKLVEDMSSTKDAFGQQKALFEDTKSKEEQLKQQLEVERANLQSYRGQLDDQNEEKKQLLDVTQNNEEKYQKLLADAKRELEQITGAVGVLKDTKPRAVKQGELIGYQGSTGYSSGEHLHFGVYKYDSFADIDGWNWYYSNYVNPADKLKSKSVYWNTGCERSGNRTVGNGNWSWPISSPTISQGFGITCWSRSLYGGKPHPAFDMYGAYGTPVYAVADGQAYFCKNCLKDGANGVFIFHKDGYMTLYWHLR